MLRARIVGGPVTYQEFTVGAADLRWALDQFVLTSRRDLLFIPPVVVVPAPAVVWAELPVSLDGGIEARLIGGNFDLAPSTSAPRMAAESWAGRGSASLAASREADGGGGLDRHSRDHTHTREQLVAISDGSGHRVARKVTGTRGRSLSLGSSRATLRVEPSGRRSSERP